jgi:hypothetical protein
MGAPSHDPAQTPANHPDTSRHQRSEGLDAADRPIDFALTRALALAAVVALFHGKVTLEAIGLIGVVAYLLRQQDRWPGRKGPSAGRRPFEAAGSLDRGRGVSRRLLPVCCPRPRLLVLQLHLGWCGRFPPAGRGRGRQSAAPWRRESWWRPSRRQTSR